MNTNYSVQRVKLLIRKDWIEYRKKLIYGALILLGVMLSCLLFSKLGNLNFRPFTLYVLGLMGTLIGFCSYVNTMIHRPKGLFLTLPASNPEKYAAILIEGLLVFLVFQATFWIGIGVFSLFTYVPPIALKDLTMTLQEFTLLAFVISLMFLSYVTFRKYALGIAFGGYILIIGSIIGASYLFFRFSGIEMGRNPAYVESNPAYTALHWLGIGFTPMFLLATLVVLYVAYLKLKEKELR